jgi:GntR family transcriptional regulator
MNPGTADITIVVDRTSEEPVYEQIARQIRTRIASGELPAGAILPPVRTLASDLGFNLNTVARAYRLLEQEGFVRIQSREGVEVAPPAGEIDAKEKLRLREELQVALVRMRQAGVPAAELRSIVDEELDALHDSSAGAVQQGD